MKSIKLVILALVLLHTSAFAYTMVDVDPVQRAVDFCAKLITAKYNGAVVDAEHATVRNWILPSHPDDFTI